MGVQLHSEILGMGELTADQPPGIACLSCGTQWADIDAFRKAQVEAPEPVRPGSRRPRSRPE
jgi:hypothetical protein